MSRAAESPFSSAAVARRPVRGQRQGHIKCSDFTAQLCCVSPPVYMFSREASVFFFHAQKYTQTNRATGLNLTSDPQPQETQDVSISTVLVSDHSDFTNPNCYYFFLLFFETFFLNNKRFFSSYFFYLIQVFIESFVLLFLY